MISPQALRLLEASSPLPSSPSQWAKLADVLIDHDTGLLSLRLASLAREIATEYAGPLGVIAAASRASGLPAADILSSKRRADCVEARRAAAAVMRSDLSLSYPAIGRALSIDHTTAMAGVKAAEAAASSRLEPLASLIDRTRSEWKATQQ